MYLHAYSARHSLRCLLASRIPGAEEHTQHSDHRNNNFWCHNNNLRRYNLFTADDASLFANHSKVKPNRNNSIEGGSGTEMGIESAWL